MANSVDIVLTGGWDIISLENTTGTVGVKGSGSVLFSEQSSYPDVDSDVGLRMVEEHTPLNFTMGSGQILYAKRLFGNCIISLTLA